MPFGLMRNDLAANYINNRNKRLELYVSVTFTYSPLIKDECRQYFALSTYYRTQYFICCLN